MASLTEAVHERKGATVLYMLDVPMHLPTQQAAKDKALLRRLEAAVIHWTRQVGCRVRFALLSIGNNSRIGVWFTDGIFG